MIQLTAYRTFYTLWPVVWGPYQAEFHLGEGIAMKEGADYAHYMATLQKQHLRLYDFIEVPKIYSSYTAPMQAHTYRYQCYEDS